MDRTYPRLRQLLLVTTFAFVVVACTPVTIAPTPDITDPDTIDTGATVNIRGEVFSVPLTALGGVSLVPGQTSAVTASLRLFSGTPSETPERGELTLRSTDIAVEPLDASAAARALPLEGTATVLIGFAPRSSTDICGDVSTFARFTVVLTAGVPSVVDDTVAIDAPTLKTIASNDVAICIRTQTDFEGRVIIENIDLTFDGGERLPSLTLRNASAEEISLLAPGEVFTPETLVPPGESRIVTLEPSRTAINIRAGSNMRGTVASADCPAVTGTEYEAQVFWDGTTLNCDANQEQLPDVIDTDGTTIQVPLRIVDGEAVAARPTSTFDGVDYAIVGMLDAVTNETPAQKNPGSLDINLGEIGLASVDSIHVATFSGFVPDLPDGTTVAELVLSFNDSVDDERVPLRLGTETAEWSFDRAEHSSVGGVAHSRGTVLYSFESSVDSAFDFTAYVYRIRIFLDTPRVLTGMSLAIADPATFGTRINDDQRAWQSVPAVTLIGTAGTPIVDDRPANSPDTPTSLPPEPEPILRGSVGGIVVNAVTGEPMTDVRIGVSGTGFTDLTDGTGTFAITDLVTGDYSLNATLSGFVGAAQSVTIREDIEADTRFEMYPAGRVEGVVVNAQTGAVLSGAQITVEGFEITSTTGGGGRFTVFAAPEGERTLLASRSGFVSASVPVTVVADATQETSIGLLEEGDGGDGVAVILTWGEDPADLDLHVSGPDESGDRFHIAFFALNPVPYGSLDLDDRESYGPETVTISKSSSQNYVAGDYRVWIHNFSNTPEFDISSAIVTIFAKGEQVGQYRVQDAAGDASMDIWRIADFTLAADGSVSSVTEINSFMDGSAETVY